MTIDKKLDQIVELIERLVMLAPSRGRDYLIREEEVCRRLQIGRATLAQWIKEGDVPPPVRIRPNKAWKSTAIDRYIDTIGERGLARVVRDRHSRG
jgi:predicted DNA-binding transcriptional regulator AlpA